MTATRPFVVKVGASAGRSIPAIYFRPGEPIPLSGIYRAHHRRHRFSHELTLLDGNRFPPCNKCGNAVQFELLRPADSLVRDADFKVSLHLIPHPESANKRAG